ncbi:hypothetical protein [Nocardia farcinica]|nr:hypothetical protein [Nocardia farcinica]
MLVIGLFLSSVLLFTGLAAERVALFRRLARQPIPGAVRRP